jgi:hypothetical protein
MFHAFGVVQTLATPSTVTRVATVNLTTIVELPQMKTAYANWIRKIHFEHRSL